MIKQSLMFFVRVHDRDTHRTDMARNKGSKYGEVSDTAQSLISLATAPEANRLAKLMADHCRVGDYPSNSHGA